MRSRDLTTELAFLTRALKAATLRESASRLAEQARSESRPPRSIDARSIEEFDFDHARGLKRDLIAHLGTLDFVAARENLIFLGSPGAWKPTLRSGWRSGCQAGHRVLFATASRTPAASNDDQ